MPIHYLKSRVLSVALALALAVSTAQAQTQVAFDLPEQPLAEALITVANRTDTNIYVDKRLVGERKAPALKGNWTAEEAVARLLQGSGLEFKRIDERTIALVRVGAEVSEAGTNGAKENIELAQVASAGEIDKSRSRNDSFGNSSRENSASRLEEITVTGTNIHGRANRSSPLTVITRDELNLTNNATLVAAIQSLPQNFSGGVSEGSIGSLASGNSTENRAYGTGINLRGLGNDSTLVLLNGHRVAASDIGASVDISSIPFAAVGRIDIVTDGASAVYGSDAVGGVVNILFRDDLDGAETSLRSGKVANSDSYELRANQSFGRKWSDGHAGLYFEYYKRTHLTSIDRPYVNSIYLDPTGKPFDLLPRQERFSVAANTQLQISEDTSIQLDGLYSNRRALAVYNFGFGLQNYAGEPQDLNLGLRVEKTFGTDWMLAVAGNLGRSRLDYTTSSSGPSPLRAGTRKNDFQAMEVNGSGSLFQLRTGAMKVAIGAAVRHEGFEQSEPIPDATQFERQRTVASSYVEALIPVLPASATSGARPAMELSLAARADHYNDFGWAFNPKIGLSWSALSGMNLRATYGESFKAPLLTQLNPHIGFVLQAPLVDPQNGATTPALTYSGGNSTLIAEPARVLTAGADFKPQSAPDLVLKATYFRISIRDRIRSPVPIEGGGYQSGLINESILGPSIVLRNPPQALVDALRSEPTYYDQDNLGNVPIGAVVDFRLRNTTSTRTSGLDLDALYSPAFGSGHLNFGVRGTYTFEFEEQVTPLAPAVDFVHTLFYPPHFKARLQGGYVGNSVSALLFANHTASYKAFIPSSGASASAAGRVESWLTFDAALSYTMARPAGTLREVGFSLDATNIFNRKPPLVNIENYFNYDSTNANALGRLVALQVDVKW